MYAKTIKYNDYNDQPHEEIFYFNLNKAEVLNMLVTDSDATLDQVFEYFKQTRNGKRLLKMIEDLIKSSYGIKSADGKSFIKRPEFLEAFVQSEAYSELLTELLNDADKAGEFFVGILPKNMQAEVEKYYKEHPELAEDNVTPITAGSEKTEPTS